MMNIQLPETDKQYYLLICEKCIYEKAKEMNIPAIYISKQEVEDRFFSTKREKSPKNYVCIFFEPLDDLDFGHIVIHGGYKEWITMCNTYEYDLGDSLAVHSPEATAKYLPRIIEDIEKYLVDCGCLLTTDYEGRCGNCHSDINKNDRFCRFCGTKRGEGAFQPYYNQMYCVYGPPILSKIRCKECGYIWETMDYFTKFCPQCGKEKLRTVERTEYDFTGETVVSKRKYPDQDTESSEETQLE